MSRKQHYKSAYYLNHNDAKILLSITLFCKDFTIICNTILCWISVRLRSNKILQRDYYLEQNVTKSLLSKILYLKELTISNTILQRKYYETTILQRTYYETTMLQRACYLWHYVAKKTISEHSVAKGLLFITLCCK